MNQKKISTEDKKKKAENEKQKNKQQKIAKKRKESGLSLVKLYLDQNAIDILSKLCERSGYSSIKPKSPNRLDIFSKVLSYNLQMWNDQMHENNESQQKTDNTKSRNKIEYYKIEQIIKYRFSLLNNKNDLIQIVQFMNSYEYPTFRQIEKIGRSPKSGRWKVDDISNYLKE